MASKVPNRSSVRAGYSIRFLALLIGQCVFFCCNGMAVELWSDPESGRTVELNTTLKLTGLGVYNPDDPYLFPERRNATGLARTRFGLESRLSDSVSAELAYEHRMRGNARGGASGMGGGALSTFTAPPWRVAALDWQVAADGERFSWRHEIDRALITFRQDWGTITAGRQAIGFGRGMLFSAVDVFAPFSPVEVDREWRRGVDALRIEYQTSALSSLELMAVFGDRWDNSALLARYRGYVGDLDGEVIIGKRARDAMFAAVVSAAVGGAAVHGELALFHTPEKQPDGGLFGNDRLVGKSVLGLSYTFNVGNGLTLLGEYHYSGFGVKDVTDALRYFQSPDFSARYLRGDSQILGRHAAALQAVYPINNVLTGGFLVLESLTDGSGLASPSLTWSASQTTTVSLNVFLPWGSSPRRGRLRSEYGASPRSLFAQVSMYF